MSTTVSKDEVDTSSWDESIGAVRPNQRILYKLQESNEGKFVISAPSKGDMVFKVEVDDKTEFGFSGLPQEFQRYVNTFTK